MGDKVSAWDDHDADSVVWNRGDPDPDKCRLLWLAVIARAIDDAFHAPNSTLTESKSGDVAQSADSTRQDARRWLTSQLYPWREDRLAVCTMAGVEPEDLEIRVRGMMTDPDLQLRRLASVAPMMGDSEIDGELDRLAALEAVAA